jgi:hypothetical protein
MMQKIITAIIAFICITLVGIASKSAEASLLMGILVYVMAIYWEKDK